MGQFITSRVEFLNFTLSYFNECSNTCFPKQFLSKMINIQTPPPPNRALVSKDFQFDNSFVYRIFSSLKFKVNASVGQTQGLSFDFKLRSLESSLLLEWKTAGSFSPLAGSGELWWSVKRRFKCVHLLPVFVSKRCGLLSWGHGRFSGPFLAFKSKAVGLSSYFRLRISYFKSRTSGLVETSWGWPEGRPGVA